MPATALRHFQHDIERSKAILVVARTIPTPTDPRDELRNDLLRSAWMFCVGALDAYLCDAWVDLVSASLHCKNKEPHLKLPEIFDPIRFPVSSIIEYSGARPNWKWRMASREMMAKKTILDLDQIKGHFNPFLCSKFKFFGGVVDEWMRHPDAERRMFANPPGTYISMNPADQEKARRFGVFKMNGRLEAIFQRRHDCIHNCDRPKSVPQPIRSFRTVTHVIDDVEFFVSRCDDHIERQFRQFLIDWGCSRTTMGTVGYP